MRVIRYLALALVLVAGCKSTPNDGYAIDFRLGFDSSVTDASLAQVTTLHLDVSGAETFTIDIATAGKLTGRTTGLRYKPGAQSGMLVFQFIASGAAGAVATGTASVTLAAGKTQLVDVTLATSVSGSDAGTDAAVDLGTTDGGLTDGGRPLDMAPCGNGVVDPGELCDPGAGSAKPCPKSVSDCNDTNDCTTDTFSGTACQASCAHAQVANGSGCATGTGVCLSSVCCTGCISNGVCLPGASDAKSCGKGGAACFDCTQNSASATCTAGQCSGCDATSCTNESRTCGTSSCGFNCGGCGDSCLNGALTHSSCVGKSCQPGTPVSCSPYATCATATTCATTCNGNSDCANGYYCDSTKHCLTQQANGVNCTDSSQCTNGHCVDGVCCDSDCNTACHACNIMDHVGACWPVAGASDDALCPHDLASTCGHSGLCDGSGNCDFWAAGTVCAARKCSTTSNASLAQSTCPGAGAACPAQASTACGNYVCAAASGLCYTRCGTCQTGTLKCGASSADPSACAPGHNCMLVCMNSTTCSGVVCE